MRWLITKSHAMLRLDDSDAGIDAYMTGPNVNIVQGSGSSWFVFDNRRGVDPKIGRTVQGSLEDVMLYVAAVVAEGGEL